MKRNGQPPGERLVRNDLDTETLASGDTLVADTLEEDDQAFYAVDLLRLLISQVGPKRRLRRKRMSAAWVTADSPAVH